MIAICAVPEMANCLVWPSLVRSKTGSVCKSWRIRDTPQAARRSWLVRWKLLGVVSDLLKRQSKEAGGPEGAESKGAPPSSLPSAHVEKLRDATHSTRQKRSSFRTKRLKPRRGRDSASGDRAEGAIMGLLSAAPPPTEDQPLVWPFSLL